MQPVAFNNSWYNFEPFSRYFEITESEVRRVTEFIATPGIHDGRLQARGSIRDRASFWLARHHRPGNEYKDAGALKADFQKALNDIIQEEFAKVNLTPIPRRDFGTIVRITADAMTTFYPNWLDYYDAYFDDVSTALTDRYLRLFVSTPYYHGPGVYRFLCRNRHLVSIPLERDPSAEKLYCNIVSRHSGKCIAVADAKTDMSAPLVQLEKTRDPHALWRIEPFGGGSFQLVVKHSNLSINMPWGSSDDGVQLVQYNYKPSSAGHVGYDTFLIKPAGDNHFHIVFKKSGKCLAVKDGSAEDNAAVVQAPISNNASALWRLEFL